MKKPMNIQLIIIFIRNREILNKRAMIKCSLHL